MNHDPFQKTKWYRMKPKNAQYGSNEKVRYSNPTCEEDLKPLQREV